MQSVQDRVSNTLKAQPTDGINGLADLRQRIMRDFGTITAAARSLGIPYTQMSAMIHGRLFIVRHVATIQRRFGLTDREVLTLWPMLQRWPKEGRAS